jgi:hypothetical protein
MPSSTRSALKFLLTPLAFALPALAQTYPAHLTNAPFTARWSATTRENGESGTTSGFMARTSDGSTYMSFASPGYPAPGGTFRIEIDDLKKHRHITLYPGPTNHYAATELTNGQDRIFSVQRYAQMLQQLQDSYLQRPDRPKPDGQSHVAPLGAKQQDGVTLYGHKSEFTSNKGEKRTQELWDSDLGIVVSTKAVWPSEDKETEMTVTDIRRVEPDPILFQIPQGYRPLHSLKRRFLEDRRRVPHLSRSLVP